MTHEGDAGDYDSIMNHTRLLVDLWRLADMNNIGRLDKEAEELFRYLFVQSCLADNMSSIERAKHVLEDKWPWAAVWFPSMGPKPSCFATCSAANTCPFQSVLESENALGQSVSHVKVVDVSYSATSI